MSVEVKELRRDATVALAMEKQPQPEPRPHPIPAPEDRPFAGVIELFVDASDADRAILSVREVIPVAGPGRLTLVYPEWLPGFHSPEGQIELLAGLRITAGDTQLEWRRDPVNVYAFHLDVPGGAEQIQVEFQHLSPTASDQGRVAFTSAILNLQWNTVVLHPAGHYARQVEVRASALLPVGWEYACAVGSRRAGNGLIQLDACTLDVLVDSPLYAGCHCERIQLGGEVYLNLFADNREPIPSARVKEMRDLIIQADALFRARHFDRYEFLCCLSNEIGGIGVEHHRSCEISAKADLFSDWESNLAARSVLCHEYVHSWNGKYRRGSDSWQPCFIEPIRNSLMWVYEGLTQYWGEVLSVRSGIVDADAFRGSVALTAASLEARPGHQWRPMRDTTKDPIIASRKPLPWPSWQRSEDYYSNGMLVWMEVDVIIRELSGGVRSLDDFAHSFFGNDDGVWTTSLYSFEDICRTLAQITSFDWRQHFKTRLDAREGPPLGWIEKGGWRLAFRAEANPFHQSRLRQSGIHDHQFSIGLIVTDEGEVKETIWDSPGFRAGLRAGDRLLAIDGDKFSPEALRAAVKPEHKHEINIVIRRFTRVRELRIECQDGLRYPHLERASGRNLIEDILRPKPL
jgi:predicted metalloprotease with PDZ domain